MIRPGSTSAIGLVALLLAGCATSPSLTTFEREFARTGRQTESLAQCLAASAEATRPILAVGSVADLTGRQTFATGRVVTQGAGLFLSADLATLGIRLAERQDTSVLDSETRLLVSDTTPGETGRIAGSRYYVSGAIVTADPADAAGLQGQAIGGAGVTLSSTEMRRRVVVSIRIIDSRSLLIAAVGTYERIAVSTDQSLSISDPSSLDVLRFDARRSENDGLDLATRLAIREAARDIAVWLSGSDACGGYSAGFRPASREGTPVTPVATIAELVPAAPSPTGDPAERLEQLGAVPAPRHWEGLGGRTLRPGPWVLERPATRAGARVPRIVPGAVGENAGAPRGA